MHEKFKLHRKRILLVLAIIAGFLLAWLLISTIYNPMRMPAPIIRIHVLRHTPIGMCMDEVIRVIENNEKWGNPVINRDNGFLHPTLFVDGFGGSRTRAIIGVQSIQTRPEIYNVPLWHRRITRILWGFDEDGKLIEVYVGSTFSPQLRSTTGARWTRGWLVWDNRGMFLLAITLLSELGSLCRAELIEALGPVGVTSVKPWGMGLVRPPGPSSH